MTSASISTQPSTARRPSLISIALQPRVVSARAIISVTSESSSTTVTRRVRGAASSATGTERPNSAGSSVAGKTTVSRVPCPGVLATSMRPSCARTTPWTMASPRPEPEAQAGPAVGAPVAAPLGGEEGLEHAVARPLVHADARVGDVQRHAVAEVAGADADGPLPLRPDGVARVLQQVEDQLVDLAGVGAHRAAGR